MNASSHHLESQLKEIVNSDGWTAMTWTALAALSSVGLLIGIGWGDPAAPEAVATAMTIASPGAYAILASAPPTAPAAATVKP